MSKSTFDECVEQFLSGTMTKSATEQLERAATDQEVAKSLVAQRSVDQLLQLVASGSQQDDFVSGCVDEFRNQFSDQVKIEPRPAATKQTRNHVRILVTIAASAAIAALGTWWYLKENVGETDLHGAIATMPITKGTSEILPEPSNELVIAPEATPGENASITQPDPTPSMPAKIVADTAADTEFDPELELAIAEPDSGMETIEHRQPTVDGATTVEIEPESDSPFGRILSNRSAVWKTDSRSKLVNGNYQLLSGSARLIFDNGIQFRVAGPAEFEMSDENSINVFEGDLFFDVPSKTKEFSCKLGNQTISNPRNARFFLKVTNDSRGPQWESLISHGSIDLAPQEESEQLVELSKKGLYQVAVFPQAPNADAPTTLIARGKRQFLGQCIEGNDSVNFKSPENLGHFLTSVVEDKNIGWNRFSKNVGLFRSQMDKLETQATPHQFRALLANHLKTHFGEDKSQFPRDGDANSTTKFRGSLIINGVARHFVSREEFDRAKRMLEQGGTLPAPGVSTSTPPQAFTIGEKKIEFSTLEMFKHLKRKMNQ